MTPTCGAEPCAAVEATDGDDEEGMGARAVLIQVGALCHPLDVAKLEDLGESRELGDEANLPQSHHKSPVIQR